MVESQGIEMFSTIVYFILIFICAILSVTGSMVILSLITRGKIDVKEEIIYNANMGIALVLSSFIWTIGRMCLESTKPIMNEWYITFSSGFKLKSILTFALGIGGALLIALFISAIAIYLSLEILMVIIKDSDEWEEIKQGNTAVAVVIGVTVIVAGMFFESITSYIVGSVFRF